MDARALAALWLALCAACRGAGFEDYAEAPGPYDALAPLEMQVFSEAVLLRERGELELARRQLATLAASAPRNLAVATTLQDVELALLAAGEPVPALSAENAAGDPGARLAAVYAERARAAGSAESLVLAARLAAGAEEREDWLAEALSADPACVWAHYARAWNHAGERRYGIAWEALSRALELDPGHLQSRRLEAHLFARGGEVERATAAYEAWLARYAGDARATPASVAEARLDLASLHILEERAAEALEVLDRTAAEELSDPIAAGVARVTALDLLGRSSEALSTAQELAAAAPLDARPRVQEALLLTDRFGDPAGARRAWEDVLARLDLGQDRGGPASAGAERGGLATLFLRLQARAALARLDEEGQGDAAPLDAP